MKWKISEKQLRSECKPVRTIVHSASGAVGPSPLLRAHVRGSLITLGRWGKKLSTCLLFFSGVSRKRSKVTFSRILFFPQIWWKRKETNAKILRIFSFFEVLTKQKRNKGSNFQKFFLKFEKRRNKSQIF